MDYSQTKYDVIPYVPLTQEKLLKCTSLLVESNIILKKWASYLGNKKRQEFRKLLFKGIKDCQQMRQFEVKLFGGNIPESLLCQFRCERQYIIDIHHKYYPDLGGTVEWTMLCGFSAIAKKLAQKWASYNHAEWKIKNRANQNKGDFNNEAYIALLNAIYGYTNPEIKFITYVHTSINNRMIRYANISDNMFSLSNNHIKLLIRFESTYRSFNDHVTFDQVIEKMGIDPKENRKTYLTLISLLRKVSLDSELKNRDNRNSETFGDEEESSDYADFSKQNKENPVAKMSVENALKATNLTEFEKALLEASMCPYVGWQSDIASKHINPKTGKPYSRMWATYALRNALEKLKYKLTA